MNDVAGVGFVLHAHMPFVRDLRQDASVEEDWLFQSLTECYLPLADGLEGLARRGQRFQLTVAVSPVLLAQLADDALQRRYQNYIELLCRVSTGLQRTATKKRSIAALADHYAARLLRIRDYWQRAGGDFLSRLRRLQQAGHLELMTCAATHGYLPLLCEPQVAVWAQIKVAVDAHRQYLGIEPTGIWLPECGYFRGLDRYLAAAGLRYCVVDSHAFELARPRAVFGSHRPVLTPAGVAVFARDAACSKQVWSNLDGYPTDPHYRDYHRELGLAFPGALLSEFSAGLSFRRRSGFKLHRVTGATESKMVYDPGSAFSRAEHHAAHFVAARRKQLAALRPRGSSAPLFVAAYDAELFGHWWYEGPHWLISVLKRLGGPGSGGIAAVDLRRYLAANRTYQVIEVAPSSWGCDGFHSYWLDRSNDWLYPELHRAAARMVRLARRGHWDELSRRALAQAARELLLAQSSDWAFMMASGRCGDYARRRVDGHLTRFRRLAQWLEGGAIDVAELVRFERDGAVFPALDYRVYLGWTEGEISPVHRPASLLRESRRRCKVI